MRTSTGVSRARRERSKMSKAWNWRGEARFEDPTSIYSTWIPEDDEITSPRWSFGKLQERRIITTTHHQSLREHLECLSLLFPCVCMPWLWAYPAKPQGHRMSVNLWGELVIWMMFIWLVTFSWIYAPFYAIFIGLNDMRTLHSLYFGLCMLAWNASLC